MTKQNWFWLVIGVLVAVFILPYVMAKFSARKSEAKG